MAQPIPSSLQIILPLVQANIAAVTGFPAPARVMIVARQTEVPHFQADADVLIRYMSQRNIMDWSSGSGRVANWWEANFRLEVRSRLYTDEANQDAKFLTDATLGHIVVQDMVTDAMEFAFDNFLDANGNSYIYEPFRVSSWSDPERERGDPMWGDSYADCMVRYLRALTQNASWAKNA